MCGIVGIWDNRRPKEIIERELQEAVRRLRHRGPDDSGTWANEFGVAFGHTRLAIIDLSQSGHQPMFSPDGRFTIIYNGEIYNHREVRKKLEAKGHTFVSSSDTEVILHAIQEWGRDAIKELIGMFAIALWDARERTLELIRDRVGVKPLYFGWHSGTLSFASELSALRAFAHWKPEINRQALGEYLQYGYISEDRSIYKGVHKLLPGHRLLLARNGQPVIQRYWSVVDASNGPILTDSQSTEAELESLLIDAAKFRMVADVPIGVYLSGGVDSTLVTGLLARHSSQTIRTFTIGFREDRRDESPWAKKIAQHFGTAHTEYILEAPEALDIARRWGSIFDEPFGDSSGIPTLLVSKLASREVKVVLSADGGDELFSGYNSYGGALNRHARIRRMPPVVRTISSAIAPAASFLGFRGSTRAERDHRCFRLQAMLKEPTIGRIFDLDMSRMTPEEVGRLIGDYVPPRRLADAYPGSDANKISLWDFHHYLPEDVLAKVDRTTMHVSIEGREPLLDHRLAEFAFRLPDNLKRGRLGSKHILKSILYRYVPRQLVERRKQGFGIPLDNWLRGPLKEMALDHLAGARIKSAGIFDPDAIVALTRDYYSGTPRLMSAIWFVLAFELWRESWLR